MRFNLVVGRIDNCEVVIDKWYDSIADVYDMYDSLAEGLCIGYYMHIDIIKNDSTYMLKEIIKDGR